MCVLIRKGLTVASLIASELEPVMVSKQQWRAEVRAKVDRLQVDIKAMIEGAGDVERAYELTVNDLLNDLRRFDALVTEQAGEIEGLQAERLEIQRALASSVLNDPTEDDDPLYSTTELVNGILGLIRRKENLLTQVVTLRSAANRAVEVVKRKRDEWHHRSRLGSKENMARCGCKARAANEILAELGEG